MKGKEYEERIKIKDFDKRYSSYSFVWEDAANNVVVNDVMDGFTITSYETPGSTTFEDGVWTIGSLNPNTL